MADPTDAVLRKRLEGIAGMKISPLFSLPAEIHDAIEVHYSSDKDIESIVRELEETGDVVALQMSPSELEKLSESKSLIRIVDSLLYFALRERASDIHLEPQESETVCATALTAACAKCCAFRKSCTGPLFAGSRSCAI